MAYNDDHITQPDYITVDNTVYRSTDNTYNTVMILKPDQERDTSGTYNVFIDCTFTEYADLGVFSQNLDIEILEPSNCAPGEGGIDDSSCSDSSQYEASDDDLGNGMSADDSSNDGYSGNDMGSSDSSGDGASGPGDNVSSDTTGDGVSDDLGRRRLRMADDFSDVEMNVDLIENEREGRAKRRSYMHGTPRSYSADAATHKHNDHKGEKKRGRKLQRAAPTPIKTKNVQKCPVGQYMAKNSQKCDLCLPRTVFVDRLSSLDLAQNSIVDANCPSAFVDTNL